MVRATVKETLREKAIWDYIQQFCINTETVGMHACVHYLASVSASNISVSIKLSFFINTDIVLVFK